MVSEKLLTISARDYLESRGKKLTDYIFVGIGVHATGSLESSLEEVKKNLTKKIEGLGAEVLVDGRLEFSYESHYQTIYLYGTALIPKEKQC